MEQEKTNIAALLKDAPRGTKLYTKDYGNVELVRVEEDSIFVSDRGCCEHEYDMEGCQIEAYEDAEPMLFPSKEICDWGPYKAKYVRGYGKNDAEERYIQNILKSNGCIETTVYKHYPDDIRYIDTVDHCLKVAATGYDDAKRDYILSTGTELKLEEKDEKQTKFKEGDEVVILNERQTGSTPMTHIVDEEIDGVVYMDNYSYGMFVGGVALAKAKEQPKFKVGDVIADNYETVLVSDKRKTEDYLLDPERANAPEQTYHLATPKEITKWNKEVLEPIHLHYSKSKRKIIHWFLPFDRVLVRSDDAYNPWEISFFGWYDKDSDNPYTCINGSAWKECLPYNENTAKLIGTTDDYKEEQE